MVDAYSKWPVVKMMRSTPASNTVEVIRSVFAEYGICVTIVSNNGPQFVATEFQNFLSKNSVKHILIIQEQTDWRRHSYKLWNRLVKQLSIMTVLLKQNSFLIQYRNALHATTKESPAVLFMKRPLRSTMNKIKPDVRTLVHKNQEKMVSSRNQREFKIGEDVACWDNRKDRDVCIPGKGVDKTRSVSYKVDIGGTAPWRRHVDQVRNSRLPTVETDVTVPETVIDYSTGPETVGDSYKGSEQSSQHGSTHDEFS